MKDHQVNTTAKVENRDDQRRTPNERDESPGAQNPPRKVMQQAASDVDRGLVDTDLHNKPGVEAVTPHAPQSAQPQPGTKRD